MGVNAMNSLERCGIVLLTTYKPPDESENLLAILGTGLIGSDKNGDKVIVISL
jgi:hypothetical protein